MHIDPGENQNWLFNPKIGKVYIKLNSVMKVTLSYKPYSTTNLFLRAMILYSSPDDMHLQVKRCANHRVSADNQGWFTIILPFSFGWLKQNFYYFFQRCASRTHIEMLPSQYAIRWDGKRSTVWAASVRFGAVRSTSRKWGRICKRITYVRIHVSEFVYDWNQSEIHSCGIYIGERTVSTWKNLSWLSQSCN